MSISIEPFVALYIIRQLRKTVSLSPVTSGWHRKLTIALFVIAVLFIAETALKISSDAVWFWHAVLLSIVYFVLTIPAFRAARPFIFGIFPFILVSLFSDITETFMPAFYKRIEDYIDYAYLITITWLIALLALSGRQQKNLVAEHAKREEEASRRKFIENQRNALEVLVAERTAELRQQKEELQLALAGLQSTQDQLIQSEKMASLGELTAGIAHEIQNPLNFVNNFSEVNSELIAEMKEEIEKGNMEEVKAIADSIEENEQKIIQHGKRADSIVKGMLQHSRTSTGKKEPTDINALADEYLRLSYHGLRAKDKSFNATMITHYQENLPHIKVIPQDMGRVLLNLFNNAFYAVNQKKNTAGPDYKPEVGVSTAALDGKIEIRVVDNGMGIPEAIQDKILQPFFTTKPSGAGTGLGLSLSYDIIVKGHGGSVKINSQEGDFAEFIIELPL